MRARVKEWLWRYGPAEVASVVLTIVPAWAVARQGGNGWAAAVAATWGGNIGYFGTILIRDVVARRRGLRLAGRSYGLRHFGHNLRLLLLEFGVAELLDSFLIRPALMYYMPRWLHSFGLGIVVAKFAADVTFYLPAIFFYEWSKRKRYRNF